MASSVVSAQPWWAERRSPTLAEDPANYARVLAKVRAWRAMMIERREWYLSLPGWRATYEPTLRWLDARVAELERGENLYQYEPTLPVKAQAEPEQRQDGAAAYKQLGLFEARDGAREVEA